VGVNPTATILNARIRDAINFLKSPPFAVLRRATNQTLTTGFGDSIKFTSEDKDSDNGHNTVTNPERYTVQTAGVYYLTATVIFAGNGTGQRDVYFRLNGNTDFRWGWHSMVPGAAGGSPDICIVTATHMRLEVGDFVEVIAHQDSGGNLDVKASNQDPRFEILWVGE
jgi:hypothetical protein